MSDGMMFFIVLIFIAVFFLVQGLAIPVFGESAQARKRLKKKLGEIETASGEEAYSSLLREKYLVKLAPWERSLEQMPKMEELGAIIEQAGLKYLAYRVVLFSIVMGSLAALIAWLYFRVWYAPMIIGFLTCYFPYMNIQY